MRGVAMGRAKEKSALLALWEANSSLPDKRPSVAVGRPPPAFAAPVAQPLLSVPALRALQDAVPLTPPRGGSAAVSPLRVVAAVAANPPAARRRGTVTSTAGFNANPFSLSDDDTSGAAALLVSAPSTPQHQNPRLTPRRQAALRLQGKSWLNLL